MPTAFRRERPRICLPVVSVLVVGLIANLAFAPSAQAVPADVYVPSDLTIGDPPSAPGSSVHYIVGFDHEFRFDRPPPIASSPTVHVVEGTVEHSLGAFNGSTVNMDGGRFVSGISANDSSTVNLTGGTNNVGVVSGQASFNFAGGEILAGFSALDSGRLNMSGGALGSTPFNGNIRMFGANFIKLSGGTITGSVLTTNNSLAADPSTVQIQGAAIGGAVIVDKSRVTLAAGRVAGALEVNSASTLTISGGEVGHDVAINNSRGTMTSGAVGAGLAVSSGSLDLSGGSVAQDLVVSSSQLLMSGGAVGGPLRVFGASSVATVTGGSIGGEVLASNGATLGISGVPLSRVVATRNSVLNLVTDVSASVTVGSGSVANLVGGSIGTPCDSPDICAIGLDVSGAGSAIKIDGANVQGEAEAHGFGSLTLTSGSIGRLSAVSTGLVHIDGGVVNGDAFVSNSSVVTTSGGSINGTMSLLASSQAFVQGGAITAIDTFSNSALFMSAGTVHKIVDKSFASIDGGLVDVALLVGNGGTANISGGAINFLDAQAGGQAFIFGGSIGRAVSSGGLIKIFGGHIDPHTVANLRGANGDTSDLITFVGADFALGSPQAGIFSDAGNDYSGVFWDLSGRLSNGDILQTRYFELEGALAAARGVAFELVPVPVPLPPCAVVFALASVGLLRRRRAAPLTTATHLRA